MTYKVGDKVRTVYGTSTVERVDEGGKMGATVFLGYDLGWFHEREISPAPNTDAIVDEAYLNSLGAYALVAPPQEEGAEKKYSPYIKGDDGDWYIFEADTVEIALITPVEEVLEYIAADGFRVVYTGLPVVQTPLEEPTAYGARVEVDGTHENEGERVVVTRLRPDEVQPWIELQEPVNIYHVWNWEHLLKRNPKVVD